MFWWIFGSVIALSLIAAAMDVVRGLPKLADLKQAEYDRTITGTEVSVIVPALDEEAAIQGCLRSLLNQDCRELEIIAVDDRSTDSTGSIMDRLAEEDPARLRVLHIGELPAGWLGKPHAMWKAAASAGGEWLLFTDGDVLFSADAVRRAVAYAQAQAADHLTIIPTLELRGTGEKIMISFALMGLAAARPWTAHDPQSRSSFGAGAFNLVRRRAYESIGSFAALRLEIVEDLKLAQRIKDAGLSTHVARGRGLISLHWASGAIGIAHNLTKNLFAVFGYRWYLAIGAALAVAAVHITPFIFVWVAPGWSKLPYLAAMAAIAALYGSFALLTSVSWLYFVFHPVGAVLFCYALLRSAVLTTWRGGVIWRGTKYPLKELRRRR